MKILRVILLLALLLPAPSQESSLFHHGGTAAPATYTGLADCASFDHFWSTAAASGAIAAAGTQPLARLTRASDAHACDIRPATNGGYGNTANCSTGGDNGQSESSFCTATTCSYQLYDQISSLTMDNNGGFIFPVAADSCTPNGMPCIQALNGSYLYTTGNTTPATGNMSIVVVGRVQTPIGGEEHFALVAYDLVDETHIGGSIRTPAVANDWQLTNGATSGGTITATGVTDGNWHIGVGLLNGASSNFIVDGVAHTGSTTPVAFPGHTFLFIGEDGGEQSVLIGVKDNAIWTPTEYACMRTKASAIWGTP